MNRPSADIKEEARNELRPNYPPAEHFMRDCGQWLEWNGKNYRAGLRVTPHLSADPGGLRAGIWAALADLVGGAVATRTVQPNWVATSDLAVHLFSPVYEGELHVTTRLLRHGKRTAIIEANFFAGDQNQERVGLATLGFSVLKARGENQRMIENGEEPRTDFGDSQKPLSQDILDRLGVEIVDPKRGQIRLEPTAYSLNTLGAVQGGVLAVLADESGQTLARQVSQPDWVTRDMTLHYLALGKTGPLETEAEILNQSDEAALVRIEILDRGEANRLVLVATLRVGTHQ